MDQKPGLGGNLDVWLEGNTLKLFRIIRHLLRVTKGACRRHPITMGLFFLCLLLSVAIEGWYRFSPLPAHNWLITNLKKIQVKDPNNFCFAVFGDNKNSYTTFNKLLRRVNRDHDIAFAIDVGDLVYDGEKEKYLYFFDQVTDNLHLPFLTAIGNHELREKGRDLYYDMLGPFYYSFHIGRTYFIVLDDANEVGLDEWQKIWLEKELQKAQGYTNRLVFLHVPLFDPRGGIYHHCLPEKSAKPLLAIFQKYHVSHIFASHIHAYFSGQWEGIPYTITGGAGGELVGTDPQHYFYHYLKVKIQGDQMKIAIKRISSPDYEWMDRLRDIIWLYLYAFIRFHGIELALFLLMGKLLLLAFPGKDDE